MSHLFQLSQQALITVKALYGHPDSGTFWERHCDVARHIINAMSDKKGIEKQVKLLNGIEIMDIFGIDQGPIVGNCLELVSEAHALGEINTKSQAIALVSKSLNQGGIGA